MGHSQADYNMRASLELLVLLVAGLHGHQVNLVTFAYLIGALNKS